MMASALPRVAGRLTANALLAPLVWFKSGGAAEYLFEPRDVADLQEFLRALDPDVSVMALGLGSNLIVRDGGVPGVVVRLGKAFAGVTAQGLVLDCGGGASGILVSSTARDHGVAGLEFLRSIPGTVGGFVRMNGGAYGGEVARRLVDCDVVLRTGELVTLAAAELAYSYRHSQLPPGAIVVAARFHGLAGEPRAIQAEMDRIAAARKAAQPLRSKTGGSTFTNPSGYRAWELVDRAGCRGLSLGGAQVSEKHTNFLINTGSATSGEIEALGEEVRRRVFAVCGIQLEWEIQRVGIFAGAPQESVGIFAGAPQESVGIFAGAPQERVGILNPPPLGEGDRPQGGGRGAERASQAPSPGPRRGSLSPCGTATSPNGGGFA